MKHYLNFDEYLEALEKNDRFENYCYSMANEQAQNDLYITAENYNIKGIETHDHYNSFFLTVSDDFEFIDSLINSDFIWDLDELERAEDLRERLSNHEENEETENEIEHFLIQYEEYLHSFEEFSYLESIVQDEFFYNSYIENSFYILNESYNKIYKDICYTESY